MEEIVRTKEYKFERYQSMNKTAQKGAVLFAGSSLIEMFAVKWYIPE